MIEPEIIEVPAGHTPETLLRQPGLADAFGTVLINGVGPFALVAARPFRVFKSTRAGCHTQSGGVWRARAGDPWTLLDGMVERLRAGAAGEPAFPLGGAFGFWGYELKRFVEPGVRHRVWGESPVPECLVFFFASLVVFDRENQRTWIVATGLGEDEKRDRERLREQADFWRERLSRPVGQIRADEVSPCCHVRSDASRGQFLRAVARARDYIRAGDIYQVNLAHRLAVDFPGDPWMLYERLGRPIPAPHAAFLNGGDFQLASASPELFLRLQGPRVVTRPIKGTRARSPDPATDLRLERELRESPKERAELVMITDLLRNDLGRVCEFGSVRVTELAKLEKFTAVQHLVSTVEGRLRAGVSHARALAACFPGGSITGAPKCRAMEIIDELELTPRGPYTGALGFIGFNNFSQFSIIIRTAVCAGGEAMFHAGAGIVADSIPEAEYEETLHKARGFLAAVGAVGMTEPLPYEIPVR